MKTLYLILLLFVQPAFLFAQITHHITFSDIQTVSSATNEDYVEIQSKELYGCFIDEHIGHNNNLGKSYTVLSDAGNVAYLGNTRQGYVDLSCILFQYFGYAVNGGNYNIGVAESVSKTSLNNNYYRYLSYCHNLLGCPEMASAIIPSRLYPYYLLVILYIETGDNEKARETASILLNKEPKIYSPAIREMKEEIEKLITVSH